MRNPWSLLALVLAGGALLMAVFSLSYQLGKRHAPTPHIPTVGFVSIVDGKIIQASNVHVLCTPGAFASTPRWSNVVIEPYGLMATNTSAFNVGSTDTSVVWTSNGMLYEAGNGWTNTIGVTMKLCEKCKGRRFLKHDDYRMPNGEIVARDVTCSRCNGEGVEGP